MGSFFTNVQARGTDRDAIVAALRADAEARGSDLVDDEAQADRSVLVLPPEDGWIAIYDQATESQDGASLERLAVLASRATHDAAISILIHDSDILDLRLYRDGARLDRLDSDPSYYGSTRVSSKKRAELAGAAEKWKGLVDDEAVAALDAAFRADDLFAEGTLHRVTEIVGIPHAQAATGYRYRTSGYEELPAGTVVLRFRDRARPAWEQASTAPPGLQTESYVAGELMLGVGDELRCSLGARSVGRASRGIGVRVWGGAIADERVAVERIELIVGDPRTNPCVRLLPTSTRSADGAPLLVAEAPDLEIPAGTASPFGGFAPGTNMDAMMAAYARGRVHVNVVGRVIAPGRAELGIGLVPRERPEATAATIVRLVIDPRFTPPLRAELTTSSYLRMLEGDAQVIACVAMPDRARLAAFARAIVEAARDERDATAAVTTTTFFASAHRPKIGRGKAKSMLRGKRWDDLARAMETERSVEVNVGDVTVRVGVGLMTQGDDLVGWCVCTGAASDTLSERWSSRLDDVVRRGEAIQALIDRRNAGGSAMLDQDAYELVCGLAPGIGMQRAYLDAHVRIPSRHRLWIASALLARLDLAQLDALADRVEMGNAVRITLRDRTRWRALEDVLSPLLAAKA